MTPVLDGRLQSRVWITAVIGGIWTLLIGPFLPGTGGASLGDVYRNLYIVLGCVLVLGLVWELIYHGLQQYRWEKDWPTFYGFLTMINEGIVVWALIKYVGVGPLLDAGEVPLSTFLVHFITTWLVTWLWANGPMRVMFIRWRYNGGRIVGGV